MSKHTIWKGGKVVATATSLRKATLSQLVADELRLFFFSSIQLTPPVLFEHLAGKALSAFLEGCGLETDDEHVEPLRYVHGRTETMRGASRVSSVLLAEIRHPEPVDEALWLSNLPTIYTKFLALPD